MQHLLLIEDSDIVRDALRTLFEANDFRVTTAGSVTEGVACALHEPADVILLDLTLPDGDGLEVITQLRATNALPRAVVALTGYDDPATRERCLASGCQAMVAKPVPVRELLALVRSL